MVDGSIKCKESEGSIHKVAAKLWAQKASMVGHIGIVILMGQQSLLTV